MWTPPPPHSNPHNMIKNRWNLQAVKIENYYMAVSYKDWELPTPRIWLAEIAVESSLDFPI